MKRFFFFIFFALIVSGCSRSPVDSDRSSSQGRVARVLAGIADESVLTGNGGNNKNEEMPVKRETIEDAVKNLNELARNIPETEKAADSFWEKENIDFNGLEQRKKQGADAKDEAVEEAAENFQPEAEKGEVLEKIEQRLSAIEAAKIKIASISLIEDENKQRLLDKLNQRAEQLSLKKTSLDIETDAKEMAVIEEEVVKIMIYGVDLAASEELALVYQAQYLTKKELMPVFLQMEEFIERQTNQGLSVSDKEMALGAARQACIETENFLEEARIKLESMSSSGDLAANKGFLDEAQEKLNAVSVNLDEARNALLSLE
ncbi:MAG: lipoprotein [Patescibacteria group bacterium]